MFFERLFSPDKSNFITPLNRVSVWALSESTKAKPIRFYKPIGKCQKRVWHPLFAMTSYLGGKFDFKNLTFIKKFTFFKESSQCKNGTMIINNTYDINVIH